jgi:hypothetical protein
MKRIKWPGRLFWNIVKVDKNTIKRMVLHPDYSAPTGWDAMAW